MTQTPTENMIPRTYPSLRLILAAVMFNNPGGITPIRANINPKKNTMVRFKLILF
jgi:hypothetical protein